MNITTNNYNWEDKTILIAEDEKSNIRFLEMLFRRSKANISIAQNGEEAIKLCKEHKPDLILMDIKMPVMDGLTATREIRKINTDIPIIAQTAFAMENDRKISIDAGCNDYISKPITKTKLFELIAKYI